LKTEKYTKSLFCHNLRQYLGENKVPYFEIEDLSWAQFFNIYILSNFLLNIKQYIGERLEHRIQTNLEYFIKKMKNIAWR
jgi:hypothetical protein